MGYSFILFDSFANNYQNINSLAVSISLLDSRNNNLFKRIKNSYNELEDAEITKKLITTLLSTTNIFLNFYSENSNRFDFDLNYKIFKNKFTPAPTYNCWGVGDYSFAIRIPTIKNFTNILEYEREDAKTRRIEFRTPSADANIKKVLFIILINIRYCLNNEVKILLPKTNNNIFQKIEENQKDTSFLKNNETFQKIKLEEFSFSIKDIKKFIDFI